METAVNEMKINAKYTSNATRDVMIVSQLIHVFYKIKKYTSIN